MKLFGRSYETVGKSESDFCIKTKGEVKIQWGSKFIDLIKDGKINADSSFIFESNSVGVKDGIYVIGEGDELKVILKVGSNQITLLGEIGTTYVSFMGELETTSDAKHQALTNIGFLCENLSNLTSDSLLNGIVYVESELKLYIIKDGSATEYSIDIPNPYPKLFMIAKTDDNIGALVIKGEDIENSIAFDDFYFYDTGKGPAILMSDKNIVTITLSEAKFLIPIITSKIQSNDASSENGYRLYVLNGESTLEVDNLVVRNGIDINAPETVYPTYWYYQTNIISDVDDSSYDTTDSSTDDTTEDESTYIELYDLTLKYSGNYSVGDLLYTYYDKSVKVKATDEDGETYTYEEYQRVKLPLKITEIEDNIITVLAIDSETELPDTNDLIGKTIFLIGSSGTLQILRRDLNNLDLISSDGIESEQSLTSINSRIGNLTDLSLKGINNKEEVAIEGSGIYTKNLAATQAQYTSDYNLPANDNSSKFASTEWIQNLFAPVDIDFTTDVVDFNTEDYLNLTEILNLINSQEDNTSNTYKGYHGLITVIKENGVSSVSGMIRGKLKDGSYSYRTINGVYNGSDWSLLSSYIIQNLFNAGYYWSTSEVDNIPVNPSYVGTTHEGFEVTSYKKYLWYTNDGDSWNLIQEYIDPDSERIYIATSIKGVYLKSDGTSVAWPAGFVCYHNGTETVLTDFGISNFTSAPDETVVPDLSKIASLTTNAVAGYIPSNSSYPFIWSIASDADKSELSNWTLEKSYDLSTAFNSELFLDWSNLSALTSNRWVKYDTSTNKITEILYPTTEITSEYWSTITGTLENWLDSEWRKYFLQTAIGMALRSNSQAYDTTFGFNFGYTNLFRVTCFGYSGYWVGRSGSLKDPTSDDPSDIGYFPTPTFDFISGHLTYENYTVDFYINGLRIGQRLNGIGQAPFANKVGAQVTITDWYEIGSYNTFTINVTDMKTGKITVINA